ncbi:MAG: tetratricopeptide repeat protein [Gammaproteobacteria bacterium]
MNTAKVSNTKPVLHRLALYVITLSIPVLFFVALEGGLRLAGFGETWPLFIPLDKAPDYLAANPEVVKRFVADRSRTPYVQILPMPFPEHKAPGTFRVFVQGGSTAAGWPYGYGASLGGMLQHRLQATFPQRNIEVIDTAMIAVNSYTVLDFADEIIAQQPDAVLIYAGHNEFLGILGVGSVVSAGRARSVVLAWLALHELRLFQLLERAYTVATAWLPSGEEATDESRGTLMHRIVGERHIPLDSPLYRRGMAQFQGNLAALLERYRQAGVPVFIGTLASNEKGLEPFISALAAETDEAAWRRHYEMAVEAAREGATEQARGALEAIVAEDDTAAAGYFALAQVLESQGDYSRARQAYLAAKDRDQLRFRAPEAFNAIIRDVAAQHGARVVEVQARLLQAAGHCIIGDDLMLEHLHPNLEGYSLLADAYYAALREADMIGSGGQAMPAQQAWNAIPVTEVDRLRGTYEIMHLKADWPFRASYTEPDYPVRSTVIERLAYDYFKAKITWPEAMKRLWAHYRLTRNKPAAARVAALLATIYPYETTLQYKAGELALEAGRPEEAVPLLRRALQNAPGETSYLIALNRACQALGDDSCSRETLQRLRELAPGHPEVEALIGALEATLNRAVE